MALDDKGFGRPARTSPPRTRRARPGCSRARRCCSSIAARHLRRGGRPVGQHQAGRPRVGEGISIQLVHRVPRPDRAGARTTADRPARFRRGSPKAFDVRRCDHPVAHAVASACASHHGLTLLLATAALCSGSLAGPRTRSRSRSTTPPSPGRSSRDRDPPQPLLRGDHRARARGEVPTEHLTHLTFEPHLGLTPWWEIGLYLRRCSVPTGTGTRAGSPHRSAGQKTSAPGGSR